MKKQRAIDAIALYENISAEVGSMLKQPPGIIVSKLMAMVLQAPTIFQQPDPWTNVEDGMPTVPGDINRMKTLNTSQSQRRQQMHVCPLQIDIVERLINRYSNPGDLVADPFAGLFTVPYEAVKMGRKGKGVELNPDYFRDGVGYLEAADAQQNAPTLFDLLESMEGA